MNFNDLLNTTYVLGELAVQRFSGQLITALRFSLLHAMDVPFVPTAVWST